MKEQTIACLRNLADCLEKDTARISRFAQDGNLNDKQELYEGSLEIYFRFRQGSSWDDDYINEEILLPDDDDGSHSAAFDRLNDLLKNREILNGQ